MSFAMCPSVGRTRLAVMACLVEGPHDVHRYTMQMPSWDHPRSWTWRDGDEYVTREDSAAPPVGES